MKGLERWFSDYEHLLFLKRSLVWFLGPTRSQLFITPVPGDLHLFLTYIGNRNTHGAHAYIQVLIYAHKIK